MSDWPSSVFKLNVNDADGKAVVIEVPFWIVYSASDVFKDMISCAGNDGPVHELELPKVSEITIRMWLRFEYRASSDFRENPDLLHDGPKYCRLIRFCHKYQITKALDFFIHWLVSANEPITRFTSREVLEFFLLGASLNLTSMLTFALTGGHMVTTQYVDRDKLTLYTLYLLRPREMTAAIALSLPMTIYVAMVRASGFGGGLLDNSMSVKEPQIWQVFAEKFAAELKAMAMIKS